jgi:hypothetical protein
MMDTHERGLAKERAKYSEETSCKAVLSTTNPTGSDPGSNADHSSEKPATDRLNYDTASDL